MRVSLIGVACFGALLVSAQSGLAQQRSPISVGVLAGLSFPASEQTDLAHDARRHIAGIVELRTREPWLAVRTDVSYQRFVVGTQVITGESSSSEIEFGTRALAAGAHVVLRLPQLQSAVRPYALGGIALFRLEEYAEARGSLAAGIEGRPRTSWRGAVGAGLGFEAPVGGAMVFAEARYQHIGENLRIMPVSIGLRLR